MSCVFVYRWNAAEGGSQRSEVDWDKADAHVGYDFDDAAEGDGAWPLDLTGDGRSELITRSLRA